MTAPPVEGAANDALEAFIAKRIGLAKGAVEVVRGAKSREKTLALGGVTVATVRTRLGAS